MHVGFEKCWMLIFEDIVDVKDGDPSPSFAPAS